MLFQGGGHYHFQLCKLGLLQAAGKKKGMERSRKIEQSFSRQRNKVQQSSIYALNLVSVFYSLLLYFETIYYKS